MKGANMSRKKNEINETPEEMKNEVPAEEEKETEPKEAAAEEVQDPVKQALDEANAKAAEYLALGHLTDQAFTVFGKSHHRRGGPAAFSIRDNSRLSAFHYSHAAVCSTQVNTDNLAHNDPSVYLHPVDN